MKMLLKELSRYQIGTYADIIYRNAILYADVEAFVYGKERVTFAEFNARVNSLIHALQSLGVKQGDVIGVLSWNCLEQVIAFGAAMKGGFIFSPYNPRLQAKDLDYIVNYSEATTIFVGPELVDLVKQVRPSLQKVKNFISLEGTAPDMLCNRDLLAAHSRDEPDFQAREDDPVYIIYTSGTTGVPRGALYTHVQAIDNIRTRLSETPIVPGNKNILTLQLFHVAGMESFQVFFFAGATTVILKSFDPVTLLKTIVAEKATDVQIVPTTLAAIFNLPDFEKYDLGSLKRLVYAASPMPLALLKKGMDRWGPIFCQFYGQTESGPIITTLSMDRHTAAYGSAEEQKILVSVGQPAIGVQVRIVDEKGNDTRPGEIGEIIARSKHIMVKYWQKPKETSEILIDGWLHTRDLGYYDEKGYIYIADRKQDMIITGGEHVFPREVEEVLYQHPAVNEAAVIGVPDPYWVERVHAVIALKKGATLSSEEIIEFCKQRMTRFKAPKSVEFVDSLPKNAAGKIVKTELRKKYKESLEKRP